MVGRVVVLFLALVFVQQTISEHSYIHEEVKESPVTLSLSGSSSSRSKRQSGREPIRITAFKFPDRIDANLPQAILQDGGSLDSAISFLSRALSVDRVAGNFVLTPNSRCSSPLATGVCGTECTLSCQLEFVVVEDIVCGPLTVPDEHIEIVTGCNEVTGQCTTALNSGTGEGLNETDTVVYIIAEQTENCDNSPSTLAYAAACVFDSSGRPLAGYINLCPSNINTTQSISNVTQYMTRILAQELLHVLGFSDELFSTYATQPVLGSETYNGTTQRAVVVPEVLQEAQDYYGCADLNGLFLEAEYSHWESRILVPELMAPHLYDSYSVLSKFTLALLEASGWYTANYTVAEQTVLGEPIPLLYGKGLGCNFIRGVCTNSSNFPYACDVDRNNGSSFCSFDGVYKSRCIEYPFTDGCTIAVPDFDEDCREQTLTLRDSSVEVAGPKSLCFMTTLTTSSTPLSQPTSTCLETQPVNGSSGHYYGLITSSDNITSINDLRYECRTDGEILNGVSPDSGTIRCNELEEVLTYQADNILQPADYCHSSCLTCESADNPSSCLTCSDSSLVILNSNPPGPCVLPDYSVRLVDGTASNEGRVEVVKSGQYSTICLDQWDQNLADVVCHQLGFTLLAEESFLNFGAVFGEGTGPILDEDLVCSGSEEFVAHCSRVPAYIGGCNHSRDASVRCSDDCTFASYESEGSCVSSCPEGLIADHNLRLCRNTTAADFTAEGFTVDATKYESVQIVGASGMLPDGTEVLRVRPIISRNTTTGLTVFASLIDDVNGNWRFVFNFNPTGPFVLRANRDVPPGVYTFGISLSYSDLDTGQVISSVVRDAEIQVLPQAAQCTADRCQNDGTCTSIVINNQLTFSCTCSPGYTGFRCEEEINECDPNPCQNGGQCMDMVNGYLCMCPNQWEGTNCENDVNECELPTDPCRNGGNCTNSPGDYSCACPPEWDGKNCTDDVDECLTQSDLCQNGGTCSNFEGGYNCSCPEGWEGDNCENDVNECLPGVDPCENGGTCFNFDGGYNCTCSEGWSGVNCEVDVDECLPETDPCRNGGECFNLDGGYNCSCPEGWNGTNCENDVNECLPGSDPCQNGGTCNNFDGGYNCTCPEGWEGINCENDIDECLQEPGPCQNGGECFNFDGGYNCTCPEGWSGVHCEVDVDECLSRPCLFGNCSNTPGDYVCECNFGWRGKNCDTDIDECLENDPCVFGTCTNLIGDYVCECEDGWNCKNCDCDVDECSFDTNPCFNGGSCNNLNGTFNCSCPEEWEGARCEDDVDECQPQTDPCQNGGTCTNFEGGYNCSCPEEWEGDNCEDDVDECTQETDLCQNGGTCNNAQGGYSCSCVTGFSGPNCEVDIRDPCEDTPCENGDCVRLNGTHYVCMCDVGYTGMTSCIMIDDCEGIDCGNGTCVDQLSSYTCSCDDGFTGESCMSLIDLCESSPCQFNATCEPGFLSYTCRCAPGYSGTNCENDIDPCSPNLCENGGECSNIDGVNFLCMCPPPYTGETCTSEIDYCAGVECLNGGACYVESFAPLCNCTEEYYGDRCQFFNFCLQQPCQNEGVCTNDGDSYTCSCSAEYTGQNCSTAVDPCMRDPSPCANGNCSSPSAGEFTCTCNPGYTGTTCSDDIMECVDNPCVNGNCTDFHGGYNCTCFPDWTGRHCEMRINPCLPNNPCLNDGICNDGIGPNEYSCDCSSVDFEGEFCESQINDCAPEPCHNNGTCTDSLRTYICVCPEGLQGMNCTEDIEECDTSPCVNGNCTEIFGSYECVCPPGFSGQNCEQDLEHCQSDSCQNGGQCIEGIGTLFTCNCTVGFVGNRCEVQDCTGNPCVNGQCSFQSSAVANFTCVCDEGYTGYRCDADIDECEELESLCVPGNCSNTFGSYICICPPYRTGPMCETPVDFCQGVNCNNGTCTNTLEGFVCECLLGYTGPVCTTGINECEVNGVTCSGNGVCRDLLNAYECICDPGYNGTLCEERFIICADDPCHGNNTDMCHDNEGRSVYTCTCKDGFTGTNCETDVDHCASIVCLNGGTCRDGILQATCECVAGFSGEYCGTNVNECSPDPCENEGTCIDGIDSYTCNCTFGYGGTNCTDYILSGLCELLFPCANSGTCMDTAESYECTCVGNFAGQNCTMEVDNCRPNNPCQNGAECVNEISGYSCICLPGYTGMDCEIFGGEPTNCTSDSECGFGYFCLRNCPVDDYPAHVAFLSSPLSLQGQSSLFVPSSRYPAYSGGDFTVVARFRQDPSNSGYLLYYSVDSQTHTFGILLNATENKLRILYTPPLPNTAHSFKTINLGIPINDNAYHTLAVVVNSKNTGYHVETIIDGSYAGGFGNDISIDTSPRVPNRDPLFIVGSRLPLPGIYRFAGRITQVAFFDTTLTLEQVNTVRTTFNELNGVLGECKTYLDEGNGCPVPRTASSSLCETTLGRCNPALRCLPDAQGYFSCQNAPIDCTDGGDVCDNILFTDGAVCGGLDFPRYGENFFERSDSRLEGMIEYLQKEPMVFDYETKPRVIPIAEHPNITTDLTIFALVDQASGNDGYVVAKGINSRTRDYSLYVKSSSQSVWLSYRASDGTSNNLVFTNVDISGQGPTTLAAIVDSDNGRAELFVNGRSVFRKILGKTPEFMPDDHMLWIGGRPDTEVYKFRGTIQDLFVSNVALSYDVIESMSRQALTGNFDPPSVSHYCFPRIEQGKYCRISDAADNSFQCAANAQCVSVSGAAPVSHAAPYNSLGTLGTCQ